MAKRDLRFPDGHKTVVCSRCGAPANNSRRGGKLVPVTGFQVGHRSPRGRKSIHRLKLHQHADPAFCELRLPSTSGRRRPGPMTPYSKRPKD